MPCYVGRFETKAYAGLLKTLIAAFPLYMS